MVFIPSFLHVVHRSSAWYKDRSDWGWRWFSTGSDLGLLFGLGVITSGPIWGSAEWGVPWDWGDLRLQYFRPTDGCCTIPSLIQKVSTRWPGKPETLSRQRDYSDLHVPITALATTWYQKRHPGIVLVSGEETGLDPAIRTVLMMASSHSCSYLLDWQC